MPVPVLMTWCCAVEINITIYYYYYLSGPFAQLRANVIFTLHWDSDEGVDVATLL